MKTKSILIGMIIFTLSCRAQDLPLQQIIPIEDYIDYQIGDIEIPDGVYFKDINNLLEKYVGTWIGMYNDKSFEFEIVEITPQSTIRPSVKFDELYIRYKITDINNNVIENTLNMPDDSPLVIKGSYLSQDLTDYFLYYVGQEAQCGQHGDIVISTFNNDTQINFYYRQGENIFTSARCPNGAADQVFPVGTPLVLTKQ